MFCVREREAMKTNPETVKRTSRWIQRELEKEEVFGSGEMPTLGSHSNWSGLPLQLARHPKTRETCWDLAQICCQTDEQLLWNLQLQRANSYNSCCHTQHFIPAKKPHPNLIGCFLNISLKPSHTRSVLKQRSKLSERHHNHVSVE